MKTFKKLKHFQTGPTTPPTIVQLANTPLEDVKMLRC